MLSSWAYFSMTIYASFYQHFEPIALQWNKRTQKLVFVSGTKRLRIWIFHTFLITTLCNGSCLFLLVREIYAPTKSSLIFLVIQMFLCAWTYYWVFSAFCCCHYGEDFVMAWNYMKVKAEQISLSKDNGKIVQVKNCLYLSIHILLNI